MVNYGSLTQIQRFAMAAIVVLTNAFGITSVISLFRRKGLQFEAMVSLMAVLTSFMYHLCQVLNCDIYLTQLKWHRLDNVFAISGMSIWALHITGSGHARKTIYLTLVASILCQERDPWNLNFTVYPIVVFSILAIILKIWYYKQIKVTYDYSKLGKNLGTLVIGLYFFYKGLDQYDDYLRINHGIWHFMAAISYYYGMICNTWEYKQTYNKLEPAKYLK